MLIARQAQSGRGGTLGEQLVVHGFIEDETLASFYRRRLLVPQVNPNVLARISPRLIKTIPADMASEFRVVPVSLDREQNLTIAMSDPSATHSVDEISFFTGMYVVRAVATQMQIAWCLAHYYGYVTELGERLMERGAGVVPAGGAGNENEDTPPQRPATVQKAKGRRPGPVTRQVEAQRHKRVAPIPGAPFQDHRPTSSTVPDEIDNEVEIVIDAEEPTPRPQRVISFLKEDTSPTGPMKALRERENTPPELQARHGEIAVPEDDIGVRTPLPAVVIDDGSGDREVGAVEDEVEDEPSGVVILDRPKKPTTAPPPTESPAVDDQPVVLLDRKKPERKRRPARRTQLGIGVLGSGSDAARKIPGVSMPSKPAPAPPKPAAPAEAPEADAPEPEPEPAAPRRQSLTPSARTMRMNTADVPAEPEPGAIAVDPKSTHRMTLEDIPAEPDFSEIVDEKPEPESEPETADETERSAADSIETAARAAIEAAAREDSTPETIDEGWTTEGIPTPILDDEDSVQKTKPIDDSETGRFNRIDDSLTDDDREFGRPGTTIPPEYLGALPGAIDEGAPGGAIPISTDPLEDASAAVPLIPLPGSAPAPVASHHHDSSPHLTPADHRELEDSSLRLVELLRELDRAVARDAVMETLLTHLAESHKRVAFFAVTAGSVNAWRLCIDGGPLQKPPEKAGLSLDVSSTFQDVVGTRLPFRGPLSDPIAQALVENVFGSSAPDVLCMPVAMRGRVIGVLYGDTPTRHVFEEHLAVVTRAAGVALERILKARKSS